MLALLERLIRRACGQLRATVHSALRSLVLLTIAGILALLGLIILSIGIYQSLAGTFEWWQAGAIVALGLLVLALLAVLFARAGGVHGAAEPEAASARRGRSSEGGDHEETTAAALGASIARLLRGARPEVLDVVIGAFIAGLLMSRDRGRPEGDRDRDKDGDG